MTIGLVGRKVGMTRIFSDDGSTQPVTVLDVSDNRITQIKTAETDGYAAVQVAFGKRRASRVANSRRPSRQGAVEPATAEGIPRHPISAVSRSAARAASDLQVGRGRRQA